MKKSVLYFLLLSTLITVGVSNAQTSNQDHELSNQERDAIQIMTNRSPGMGGW